MKKMIGFVATLAILALLFTSTGCVTFRDRSGKTLASIVHTVEAGMKAWATFVAIGGATPQQEASVKALYEKYQACERMAESAYVSAALNGDKDGFARAVTVLQAIRSDLLLLISTFNPKGQTK